MKKINVIGTSGSGKSTFSRALAKALGIEYIEMDAVFWRPDWQEPEDADFFSDLKNAISGDAWVLDGNYSRTREIKWEAVDTVIWLDYSFFRTFYRIVSRSVKRAMDKKELWPGTGNTESFYKAFLTKDSIILWMLKNYGKTRRKCTKIMNSQEWSHIRFIRLTTPKQTERFIENAGRRTKF